MYDPYSPAAGGAKAIFEHFVVCPGESGEEVIRLEVGNAVPRLYAGDRLCATAIRPWALISVMSWPFNAHFYCDDAFLEKSSGPATVHTLISS